ncbi:hypothetical protein AAOGI_41470 [Agarivorans albus]
MKYFSTIVLSLMTLNAFAVTNHCGEIKRLRTWVNGSDTYGVWVEFKANPQRCPGGFYMPQTGNNRDLVYSTVLASKMANQKICFQVHDAYGDISNRCKINYVFHE